MALIAAGCLCALRLQGCVSLPGATTEQVGNRRVEFVLATKAGPPVVVFESGLGGTLDWWAKVFPAVSMESSAFAYNRPGYGNSDRASTPRDGTHVVDELRSLLRDKGLDPPYVLVGHSLGGLYVQLFARRYPDEVAALVLVDSTHPAQFQGKGSPQNWPGGFWLVFRFYLSSAAEQEFNAIDATGETVLALPAYSVGPVFVLSASRPAAENSALARDANEKRKDIARLYPGSRQIWVDSGHGIPRERPEAVIAAVHDALSAVRSRCRRSGAADPDRHASLGLAFALRALRACNSGGRDRAKADLSRHLPSAGA